MQNLNNSARVVFNNTLIYTICIDMQSMNAFLESHYNCSKLTACFPQNNHIIYINMQINTLCEHF